LLIASHISKIALSELQHISCKLIIIIIIIIIIKVIPVIIGAIWIVSKSFRKYVSNIPGKHEVKKLQKTAILGTAHVLQKVLM